jgi:hypothetical protein
MTYWSHPERKSRVFALATNNLIIVKLAVDTGQGARDTAFLFREPQFRGRQDRRARHLGNGLPAADAAGVVDILGFNVALCS